MLTRSSVICPRLFAPHIASHNPTGRLALPITSLKTTASTREFSTSKMSAFPTPSKDPPKKEMVYYPNVNTAIPSKSAEFRRVLWTRLYSQLVLMTVPVGGDIGEEVQSQSVSSNCKSPLTFPRLIPWTKFSLSHPGSGLAQIAGKEQDVKAGDMITVPAGTKHQFLNTGAAPLILYTVYSPAEHKPTTVHQAKEQGDKEEEDGIDVAPEWSSRSKKQNEDEGWVKGEE
ncbi:cupin domain-containing protein [Diaporthe sp. PMI_573]|nr:cupin domain-containing protein [Diaporthaceae sp. PMI_573]